MSTNHDDVKELLDEVKVYQSDLLANLKRCGFKVSALVGEDEQYEVRGLVAGLGSLITDIKVLVRSGANYYAKTTKEERSELSEILGDVRTLLITNKDILDTFADVGRTVCKDQSLAYTLSDGVIKVLPVDSLPEYLDKLKTILRPFNIRKDPERVEVLEEYIAELQRLITNTEPILEDTSSLKDRAKLLFDEITQNKQESTDLIAKASDQIESFDEKLTQFSVKGDEIDSIQTRIEGLYEEATEIHGNFSIAHQDILTKTELVDGFVKKIASREKQLEQQGASTENYETSLSDYNKKHKQLLADAEFLINDAKEALSLSGSVALGRHFEKQHNDSKEFYHRWLYGSAVFIASAMAIGVWVLLDHKNSDDIAFAFARLSLMPISIAGAWFCASQFVKQKNIIEDYAYKKVLALSLVSFKEELQNENVSDHLKSYLNMALKEIHRYPLEALQSDSTSLTDREMLKELKKIIPEFIKSQST